MRIATSLGVAFLGLVIFPLQTFAQAWVPPKDEGAVSLAVQNLYVKKHLAGATQIDAGHINTFVLLADMTYGLTDKVAVDLAVPFVSSKYSGHFRHPNTTIDDETFHSSVTDIRMSLRYNVTRKGMVFTPFVGSIIPSHNYPYYGHAAPGERLRELQIGAYAGKLFTSGVPGMFVSGRAGYGFVQKVADISHNRSIGDLEAGYFITPGLRIFGTASAQYTHGGIEFPVGGLPALPPQYKTIHDIIQHVNFLNAGGGFAYSVTDSVDMFASFTRMVVGRNGHALNRGITLGASWTFRRGSNEI